MKACMELVYDAGRDSDNKQVLKVGHLGLKPCLAIWPLCDPGPQIPNLKNGETISIPQSCCED